MQSRRKTGYVQPKYEYQFTIAPKIPKTDESNDEQNQRGFEDWAAIADRFNLAFIQRQQGDQDNCCTHTDYTPYEYRQRKESHAELRERSEVPYRRNVRRCFHAFAASKFGASKK